MSKEKKEKKEQDLMGIPEMDATTAQQLAQEGGTLLCLDVPPGTRFGMDYVSWTVGEKFKGVKFIPPGVHYVHYSPSARGSVSVAPLSGFFLQLQRGEVVVKRWDPSLEALVDYEDKEQAERLALGVKRFEFDQFLGPYPLNSYDKWKRLTSFITESVVSKLEPVGKVISSATPSLVLTEEEKAKLAPIPSMEELLKRKRPQQQQEQQDGSAASSGVAQMDTSSDDAARSSAAASAATSAEQKEGKEERKPREKRTSGVSSSSEPDSFHPSFYSRIPKADRATVRSIKQAGSAAAAAKLGGKRRPEEVTQMYMDKTHWLLELASKEYGGDLPSVLGELQFAFVTFLMGESLEGFEQWKALVALLCECESGVEQHPDLFKNFIDVLTAQLKEVPKDFFIDELSRDNFIGKAVQSLIEICLNTPSLPQDLQQKVASLQSLLKSRFGLDLSALIDPEDQPVVVELDTPMDT